MTKGARLLSIIAVALTVILMLQTSLAAAARSLAVLPFRDRSGFKGQWDLGNGIPRLLSARLAQVSGYRVAEFDSLSRILGEEGMWSAECEAPEHLEAIFDSLEVGYLICGSVDEFGISRFGIVTPSVGGFESYRAGVKASFILWERQVRTPLLEAEVEGEKTQKGLGLTFLGRPTEQMEEYELLEHLEFGSPLYMKTIAGEATEVLLTDMAEKIQVALPPQRSLGSASEPAVILLVEKGQVYFNRGYDDGVKLGDEFVVYARGEEIHDPQTGELLGHSDREVGRIRVTLVKSTHLSQAEVVGAEGEIVPGDQVRAR
jgi:TolB-like protein